MPQVTAMNRRFLLITAASLICILPAHTKTNPLSITVYKSPTCGCCAQWVDRLKEAGFSVAVDDRADLEAIKAKYGVPQDLVSCHTGVIGELAIEGHVPPADIKKFMSRRRKSLGIAVAGMPTNSPGMEMEGTPNQPFTVWEFYKNGKQTAFNRHN